MPTYEYECKKCGQQHEIFQKITDSPVKQCPACGGEMKRLISSESGLIFKGSGFYITDYKKKNNSSLDKNKSESKSGDRGNKDKSESKPQDKGKSKDKSEDKK